MSVRDPRPAAAQRTAARKHSVTRIVATWLVAVPLLAFFSFSVVAGAATFGGAPPAAKALDRLPDSTRVVVQVEASAPQTLASRCDFPRMEAEASAALDLAERSGDRATIALALAQLATARFALGEGVDAAAMDRALALEATVDRPLSIYDTPSSTYGVILGYIGDSGTARRLLERQLRLAEKQGDEAARGGMMLHLGYLEYRDGRTATGEARASEHEALAVQLGLPQAEAYGHFMRLWFDVELGRERDARTHAAAALAYATAADDKLMLVGVRSLLASLELSKADSAAAWRQIESLPRLMRRWGWREPAIHPVHTQAVEALVGLGRLDEASVLADELEELCRGFRRPLTPALLARCRGLVSGGRGEVEAAIGFFESGLSLHPSGEYPLDEARTLLALGTVLRRARRWRDARSHLEAARDIFGRHGAVLWETRATDELRRIGGRRTATGLTPTEDRVARVVAAGRSNKEAAAQLSVTVRTIESNLSRIYAKLGIASRTQLAARLGDR